MTNVTLQELVFPELGKCTEEELYFRSSKKVDINATLGTLFFGNGDVVSFDTYFNGLSISKWIKYTVVDNVSLSLTVKGSFRLTMVNKDCVIKDLIETIEREEILECEEVTTFTFPYTMKNLRGMLTFKLEALSKDSVLYDAAYVTEVEEEKLREVKIGICICTFRREEFIENNLRILRESIFEEPTSDLYGKLEVFISDNGKTLDRERLGSEFVHINPNKNVGGAGGFTRDLIEIMACNDTHHVTHALLMDDDIIIEPESILRTYRILRLLKDQYKDAFVGGAMLRKDFQYKQVENGASWNAGQLISLKTGLDLRKLKSVLFNEVEEYMEYNAWWYCCFPMEVVTEDNLPLPIFIRGDDLEYGLRNMKNMILMNGICVWHEPFENKYSSFVEYYVVRNKLIDNAFYFPEYGKKHIKREILQHSLGEMMRYRYKNVELFHRGIKDFLKGPEFLLQQDGEALHQEIMAAGYKFQPVEDLEVPFLYSDCQYHLKQFKKNKKFKWGLFLKQTLTMNGLFFPVKQEYTSVLAPKCKTYAFYRVRKVINYDVTTEKGFVTEKNIGQSLKYLGRMIALLVEVDCKYNRAKKLYQTQGLELRKLSFWKKYLGLE